MMKHSTLALMAREPSTAASATPGPLEQLVSGCAASFGTHNFVAPAVRRAIGNSA